MNTSRFLNKILQINLERFMVFNGLTQNRETFHILQFC